MSTETVIFVDGPLHGQRRPVAWCYPINVPAGPTGGIDDDLPDTVIYHACRLVHRHADTGDTWSQRIYATGRTLTRLTEDPNHPAALERVRDAVLCAWFHTGDELGTTPLGLLPPVPPR